MQIACLERTTYKFFLLFRFAMSFLYLHKILAFPPYEHGTRRAPWLEGLPSAILQGLCFVSPYRPDKAANNR